MHYCILITKPNNSYHTMVTSGKILINFFSCQKQGILHKQAAMILAM